MVADCACRPWGLPLRSAQPTSDRIEYIPPGNLRIAVFLCRKSVLETGPDLALPRQHRLPFAGAMAGKQLLYRLLLQISAERHRPLRAGKLQMQAADDGVDPLIATHLLGPRDDVLGPA